VKWKAPVVIGVLVLLIPLLYLLLERFEPEPAGCFTFSDGTVQNWTLDQSNLPNTSVAKPFQLLNNQNVSLAAEAAAFYVLDETAKTIEISLTSPSLEADENWQNLKGFKLGVHRQFATNCGIGQGHSDYKSQLQILIKGSSSPLTDTPQTTLWDKQTDLSWQSAPPGPNDIVEAVRVRHLAPVMQVEGCPNSGRWLIGNVCPIKE
jgi:hypothetical protein